MADPKFIKCPCCGNDTLAAPVKLDEVSKLHYISCMISGVPYSKEYEVFGGKLKITASELNAEQQDKCLRLGARIALAADERFKEILADILTRIYRLLPVVNIKLTSQKGEVVEYPIQQQIKDIMDQTLQASNADELKVIYDKLVDPKVFTAVSPVIIDKVVQTHNRLIDMFITSGFDQDFSKGIPQSY